MIYQEFQCESECWRRSLKEILMIRFEINDIIVGGLAFKRELRFFQLVKF